MNNIEQLSGKKLAIAVAKKIGRSVPAYVNDNHELMTKDYLQNRAAEILFSPGMAGKIYDFMSCNHDDDLFEEEVIAYCFRGEGTLTSKKILNTWLQIDD